jgi:hypothetical protein
VRGHHIVARGFRPLRWFAARLAEYIRSVAAHGLFAVAARRLIRLTVDQSSGTCWVGRDLGTTIPLPASSLCRFEPSVVNSTTRPSMPGSRTVDVPLAQLSRGIARQFTSGAPEMAMSAGHAGSFAEQFCKMDLDRPRIRLFLLKTQPSSSALRSATPARRSQ